MVTSFERRLRLLVAFLVALGGLGLAARPAHAAGTSSLAITVTNTIGEPLTGVSVQLDGAEAAVTDDSGMADVADLLGGYHSLALVPAADSPYLRWDSFVFLAAEGTTPMTVQLQRGATVRVAVSTADGAPVASQPVTIVGTSRTATTDETGVATFTALQYSYLQFAAYGPLLSRENAVVFAYGEQPYDVSLTVYPSADLTLTVTGPDGAPAAGAQAMLYSVPNYWLNPVGPATVDSNGAATMSGIVAGDFFLAVSPPAGSSLVGTSQEVTLARPAQLNVDGTRLATAQTHDGLGVRVVAGGVDRQPRVAAHDVGDTEIPVEVTECVSIADGHRGASDGRSVGRRDAPVDRGPARHREVQRVRSRRDRHAVL